MRILKVAEIFVSLEGETVTAGFPALFIRLAGCNLRCSWCDTKDSWNGGVDVPFDDLLAMVKEYSWVHHITITGGEPLAQIGCIDFLKELSVFPVSIQLETNGTISLSSVPKNIRIIADIKPPSSGCTTLFLKENFTFLDTSDEIKIVAADENDLDFISRLFVDFESNIPCPVSLSPGFPRMDAEELAAFILKNHLPARLNLQQHKIIWKSKKEAGIAISLEKYSIR
jgi:7-carboxy-7-deazaguanine synthase